MPRRHRLAVLHRYATSNRLTGFPYTMYGYSKFDVRQQAAGLKNVRLGTIIDDGPARLRRVRKAKP